MCWPSVVGLVGAAQRERFRVPASTTHGPLFARSLSAVEGFCYKI